MKARLVSIVLVSQPTKVVVVVAVTFIVGPRKYVQNQVSNCWAIAVVVFCFCCYFCFLWLLILLLLLSSKTYLWSWSTSGWCCCCLSQKPSFEVWSKLGQQQLWNGWHWVSVVVGGGKVIFMSNPSWVMLNWGRFEFWLSLLLNSLRFGLNHSISLGAISSLGRV